jgi:hypothetical protein
MHIEDLIATLAANFTIKMKSPYHKSVINSIFSANVSGIGLTEKQKNFALSIIKQYVSELNSELKVDITQYLNAPTLRFPLRSTPAISSLISIEPHSSWDKALAIKFPYNGAIIQSIKSKLSSDPRRWDPVRKIWLFALTEDNIKHTNLLATQYGFETSDEFKQLVECTMQIMDSVEDHVPMVTYCNEKLEYRNVSDTVPTLDTTDVIRAAFLARASGITTWDSNFSAAIEAADEDSLVKSFLKNSGLAEPFEVKKSQHSFDSVCKILSHSFPTIVVVPGGSELEKTTLCVQALERLGVEHRDMSVLFRLPSKTGSDFNQYVKANLLNSAIGKNTKVVFISGKLPKPVLTSGIQFNSAVNVGWLNHWPQRYIKLVVGNCPNIINYRD